LALYKLKYKICFCVKIHKKKTNYTTESKTTIEYSQLLKSIELSFSFDVIKSQSLKKKELRGHIFLIKMKNPL